MCEQLIQRFASHPMYREAAVRLREYDDKLDTLSGDAIVDFVASQNMTQINADRALLADAMSHLLLEGASNG